MEQPFYLSRLIEQLLTYLIKRKSGFGTFNIGERRIEKRLICDILKSINFDENPVRR
jgi:hypothetical protein